VSLTETRFRPDLRKKLSFPGRRKRAACGTPGWGAVVWLTARRRIVGNLATRIERVKKTVAVGKKKGRLRRRNGKSLSIDLDTGSPPGGSKDEVSASIAKRKKKVSLARSVRATSAKSPLPQNGLWPYEWDPLLENSMEKGLLRAGRTPSRPKAVSDNKGGGGAGKKFRGGKCSNRPGG